MPDPLHQRQVIRDAVALALKGEETSGDPPVTTYATTAGNRVFESRVVPWNRNRLPAIAVYTLDEQVDPDSAKTAPRRLKRVLQLAIEGAVSGLTNVDDAMDALALQIERVMHADETFGGVAMDSLLSSTELATSGEGDNTVGLVRLVYQVAYETDAPAAADVPLDDLETVGIRYNLAGEVHQDNEAEDELVDLDQ